MPHSGKSMQGCKGDVSTSLLPPQGVCHMQKILPFDFLQLPRASMKPQRNSLFSQVTSETRHAYIYHQHLYAPVHRDTCMGT